MKKILLLVLVLFAGIMTKSNAQCPGCLIDSTLTQVGIYPDTLPPGIVNTPYDTNITFIMFTDTFGLTVDTFQILTVTGLPLGMSWECNNSGNGCVYLPQQSIYGCVKICGTPTQVGFFNMVVTVQAVITGLGPQTVTFIRPFFVYPQGGSNFGFSFNPGSACDSAVVQFTSLLTAYEYSWDFGNGNTDSVATSTQVYNAPGIYPVSFVPVMGYNLDSVMVTGVPDNYNVNELGLDPQPDLYFDLTDSTGAVVFSTATAVVNDVTLPSYTWTNLNFQMTDQNYSLAMRDYDLIGGDDNLGTVTWNGASLTGTLSDSVPGINGWLVVTYYTSKVVFNISDTVRIYASPASPVITSLQNDTICDGDNALISLGVDSSNIIQWYNDTVLLVGANYPDLNVNQSGIYFATVQDVHGCSATSSVYDFTVLANPPKPTYSVNGNTLTCYLTGYNLQWFVNGTLINGATDTVLNATVQGLYNVVASNNFGCSATSDTVLLLGVGLINLNDNVLGMQLVPNNGKGIFELNVHAVQHETAQLIITDLSGRVIQQKQLKLLSGKNKFNGNLSESEAGTYLIQLKTNNQQFVERFVKLK